jgi:hypothetical protein
MSISERVLNLFENMSFKSIVRDRFQNAHCFLSFIWQNLFEMVTNGELMLSLLPCHREFRILEYSESHCCPATKRQDD